MALAEWPAGVPTPLMDAQREQKNGLLIEDEVINPERNRRLPEHEAEISVMMTAAEFATFKSFVTTTLYNGQAAFTAAWLAYIGFSTHAAAFIMPYSVSLKATKFFVVAQLRTINIG